MAEKAHQLHIQALGRQAYLGQLYDARSNTLLPSLRLFPANTPPTRSPTPSMNVDLCHVRSIQDRTSSLHLSASLSLSILGGAIHLSGLGAYLDSKSEHGQSVTMAAIGRFRTMTESVDVVGLRGKYAMTSDEVAATPATHVVSEITYGGNIIGSATQTYDISSSESETGGGFDTRVLGSVGELFGIGGKAEVSSQNSSGHEHAKVEVSLATDFLIDGQEDVPTTVAEITAVLKKSRTLVGDGIPCELVLIPLSWLNMKVPTFRELSEASLLQLTDLYDRIVSLGKNRRWLVQSVEEHSTLFPSYLDTCRKKAASVNCLVQEAREELRVFLEKARSEDVSKLATPLEFHAKTEARFLGKMDDFERDKAKWIDMLGQMRTADDHGFPATSVSQLKAKISRDHSLIVLIIVPEEVHWTDLVETYRVHAQDIRKWGSTLVPEPEDDATLVSVSSLTDHATIFADRRLDRDLLQLDKAGSVARALAAARKEAKPVLLTYGFSRDGLSQLEWKVLNQEGWGVLVDHQDKWRYIGDICNGRPHGTGVMTYVDGSDYTGNWVRGKREGLGKLVSGAVTIEGVFIDDKPEADGVVVSATVYRGQTPVDFARVALRRYSSTQEHVQRMASVFGWQTGKRFRVVLECLGRQVQVRVNGSYVDPSEDPNVAFQPWPLDAGGEKVLKVYQS